MRNTLLGVLLGAGFVTTAVVWWNSAGEAHAQRPPSGHHFGGEIITHQATVDDHRQQLTVIDPQLRTACIYHIDRDSGEISLKSVRNIHWDLQLSEFNSTSPKPQEIRAMLEQH